MSEDLKKLDQYLEEKIKELINSSKNADQADYYREMMHVFRSEDDFNDYDLYKCCTFIRHKIAEIMKPEISKDDKFRLEQQQMSNTELAELARAEVSKLCKTGGRSFTMCVPPTLTDTDMLLCEVIRRLEALTKEIAKP